MKRRVLDLLTCREGEPFELRNPGVEDVAPPTVPIERVACASHCSLKGCHPSQGVTPDDCRRCFSQEIVSGELVSRSGERYAIAHGVPRLIPEDQLDARTQQAFSLEWKYSKPGRKNFGEAIELREEKFLDGIGHAPHELEGKLLLNAGCGSGILDEHLARRFGLEILPFDQSTSPFQLQARNDQPFIHPVQASVLDPPVRRGAFDLVMSMGVLHHTRSTREAFQRLAPAVRRGGRLYVWIYHSIDREHFPTGYRKAAAYYWIREHLTSRLPVRLQEALYHAMVAAFMVKQGVEYALGRRDALLTWGEQMQSFTDTFSPTYAWRHSEEEVRGWFEEQGFTNLELADQGPFGFGMRGDLP